MKKNQIKLWVSLCFYFLFTNNGLAQDKLCSDPEIRKNDPTHIIKFDVAAATIYDFYNNFKIEQDQGVNYAPGWVEIEKEMIPGYTSLEEYNSKNTEKAKKDTAHCGIIFYICKAADDLTSRCFLAYEAKVNSTNLYDTTDAYPIRNPRPPNAYNLNVTGYDNHFADNQTFDQIKNFLKNNSSMPNPPVPPSYTFGDLNNYAYYFMNQTLKKDPGAIENPVGFFHYEQIEKLFDQIPYENLKGMRIYWGYEKSGKFDKIRIIAFAVRNNNVQGKDGMNYCFIRDDEQSGSAVILERSWPPDAY